MSDVTKTTIDKISILIAEGKRTPLAVVRRLEAPPRDENLSASLVVREEGVLVGLLIDPFQKRKKAEQHKPRMVRSG